MNLTVTKEAFLSDPKNKQQFIDFLGTKLTNQVCNVLYVKGSYRQPKVVNLRFVFSVQYFSSYFQQPNSIPLLQAATLPFLMASSVKSVQLLCCQHAQLPPGTLQCSNRFQITQYLIFEKKVKNTHKKKPLYQTRLLNQTQLLNLIQLLNQTLLLSFLQGTKETTNST